MSDYSDLDVLLVEDNVINQKVALGFLKAFGIKPDVASHGRQAVEMFSSKPYRLIFMDCEMPEMNGFEATKTIRKNESDTEHCVIIAMTAYAMEGDKERCIESGMDDYISKPYTSEQIASLLQKWLPE